jgi:CRISPR system Cascade subunit CasB
MWAFYTTLNDDGNLSERLRAEHIALTLFGVHQQSRSLPAHRTGVGFGTAVRGLCDSGNFSEEAIDRRFAAAATASSLNEVGVHLRGLVTQMKSGGSAVVIDYTRLFWDLCDWQRADRRSAVRRRWGSQYFARSKAAIGDNDDASKAPAAS